MNKNNSWLPRRFKLLRFRVCVFLEDHGADLLLFPFETPQGAIVFVYIPIAVVLCGIGGWSLWALLGTLILVGTGLWGSIYLLYPRHLIWYKRYQEEWVRRYDMILAAISPGTRDSFQEDKRISEGSFRAMNILANVKQRLSAELLEKYDDLIKVRLLESFQDEIRRTYFEPPHLFIGYDEIVKVIDPFTSGKVFLKPEDYVGGETSLVEAILKCQSYMLEKNIETINQIRDTFSKYEESDNHQIDAIESYFSERKTVHKKRVE